MLVFHLFFERVLVVPVNLRVGSGSIEALEFGEGDIVVFLLFPMA